MFQVIIYLYLFIGLVLLAIEAIRHYKDGNKDEKLVWKLAPVSLVAWLPIIIFNLFRVRK